MQSEGGKLNTADSFLVEPLSWSVRDGGGIAATKILIGGRWKQLEMMGVCEKSFLDSGRRNNGLGPFCLENKAGARRMVMLWRFRWTGFVPLRSKRDCG